MLTYKDIVKDGANVLVEGLALAARTAYVRQIQLEKIGLMAPQVTYVIEELTKAGIKLPHNAITVEQAVDSIMKATR